MEGNKFSQIMTVTDRHTLTLNGVKNVESFDEEFVSLATEGGKVCIEGNGLKIESLSKDGGNILIIGVINGVYYSDEAPKTKGLLGRIFK